MMTGEELKALRNELGLSIAQVARQLEVSSRTIARWQSGNETIPAGVVKLFRILNGLESIPPVPPRRVRVNITTDNTIVSTVRYVRDPDDGGKT